MRLLIIIVVFLLSYLPCNANLKSIEASLKSKIQGHVLYSYVPRGLVVSVSEEELFCGTCDKIDGRGLHILNAIAQEINSFNNICIIEGHTRDLNKNGSKVYSENWELSLARANKLALYFIRCNRVDPNKIFSIGYGEYMPFHDNVSYTGNLNNRIDFVFLDYGKLRYD